MTEGEVGTNAEKTILVVEDEELARNVLTDALRFFGYKVISTSDGFSALNSFKERHPHLVIADIYVPGMNGILLLRNIRRLDPSAKVILITGYKHFAQLVYDERSRPDGYFEKPIVTTDFVAEVERLIGTA